MAIILALALVHGLLYVFLVPPWQHYDEPAHFEYVWLKGHGKELTWEGDQGFRKTVLRSMIANDFYRGSQPPNPNAPGLVFWGFRKTQTASCITRPPGWWRGRWMTNQLRCSCAG